MSDEAFTITDFALSTQKKFATKLASTGAIRNKLIDEESEKLFKTIHQIYKIHFNDKKLSEKLRIWDCVLWKTGNGNRKR